MRSVFVSHSTGDARTAEVLSEVLRKDGIRTARADDFVAKWPRQEGKRVRADAALARSELSAEVLSAIRRSSMFIALIDDLSPNVMFELGYALGAFKPVLLLGSVEAKIPVDVASLQVIRVDRFDPSSWYSVVEKIRAQARDELIVAPPKFQSAKDQLIHMLENADYLESVWPQEFEQAVLDYFREVGFAVDVPDKRHDMGFDFLVSHGSFSAVVEVKKYSRNSRVGVANVHQLLGAMVLANAGHAVLITTTEFSTSAVSMAERAPRPVLLLTLHDLLHITLDKLKKVLSERSRARV